MKKYLIYLIILCFIFLSILTLFHVFRRTEKAIAPKSYPNGILEFTFENQNHSDLKARQIVYWHILKAKNKSFIEIIREYKNVPDNVYACFIDLNNDGLKDIIGMEKDDDFHRFFISILLKNKWEFWEYESNHSFMLNGYFRKLYVLNTKTQNYKDIRTYGIYSTYGSDCILKYKLNTKYYEFLSCK